ncbi:EamA family transporter [Bacteroides finegoldii]|jgi:drug/metabolite transporter (DMT)-like permease|uniref:EamA family transporter n=1 Tax=Bacteroides finegoldii TaxID=338188 RepID=UPI00189F4151|nr:EamA family transporter [Bacteroides finegoldii]
MGYLYVIFTILFTVYGQVILKWRISDLNWSLDMTGGIGKMIVSYMKFLFDPLIFSGFISAFIASVFWMLAMTKFELTYAYPFMALSPALVFIIGIFVLGETFTIGKVLGLLVIMIGIIITVKV